MTLCEAISASKLIRLFLLSYKPPASQRIDADQRVRFLYTHSGETAAYVFVQLVGEIVLQLALHRLLKFIGEGFGGAGAFDALFDFVRDFVAVVSAFLRYARYVYRRPYNSCPPLFSAASAALPSTPPPASPAPPNSPPPFPSLSSARSTPPSPSAQAPFLCFC